MLLGSHVRGLIFAPFEGRQFISFSFLSTESHVHACSISVHFIRVAIPPPRSVQARLLLLLPCQWWGRVASRVVVSSNASFQSDKVPRNTRSFTARDNKITNSISGGARHRRTRACVCCVRYPFILITVPSSFFLFPSSLSHPTPRPFIESQSDFLLGIFHMK